MRGRRETLNAGSDALPATVAASRAGLVCAQNAEASPCENMGKVLDITLNRPVFLVLGRRKLPQWPFACRVLAQGAQGALLTLPPVQDGSVAYAADCVLRNDFCLAATGQPAVSDCSSAAAAVEEPGETRGRRALGDVGVNRQEADAASAPGARCDEMNTTATAAARWQLCALARAQGQKSTVMGTEANETVASARGARRDCRRRQSRQ